MIGRTVISYYNHFNIFISNRTILAYSLSYKNCQICMEQAISGENLPGFPAPALFWSLPSKYSM